MHGNHAEFLASASTGLGLYYLLLSVMNAVTSLLCWRRGVKVYGNILGFPFTNVLAWLLLSGFFLILSPIALIQLPLPMPKWIQDVANYGARPEIFTVLSVVGLGFMYVFRRFFSQPAVGWLLLNLSLLVMGMSMTNSDFASIVTKPDNVPIVGLVFLLGFFTWLATHQAVINDDRAAHGLPPMEKLDDEKVLVWPDLVYTELICMIGLTALLLVWAIALQAPLEEPASSVKTPNPSKAPWYFLGLQEMLVYFDPWYAGVVLPSVVVFGLMAIPFLDFNKKGNGYYTISERQFAYLIFQFGFLALWVVLIILGTFLRGPNWNIFGPFENWDPHKVLALNNVNLSEYFWIYGLHASLPKAPTGSGAGTELLFILYREAPGIFAMGFYLIALPPLMAATIFRKFFVKMGFLRFMLMSNLLLLMASLPLKMVLRWTLNLKYIISIPEYFLNF